MENDRRSLQRQRPRGASTPPARQRMQGHPHDDVTRETISVVAPTTDGESEVFRVAVGHYHLSLRRSGIQKTTHTIRKTSTCCGASSAGFDPTQFEVTFMSFASIQCPHRQRVHATNGEAWAVSDETERLTARFRNTHPTSKETLHGKRKHSIALAYSCERQCHTVRQPLMSPPPKRRFRNVTTGILLPCLVGTNTVSSAGRSLRLQRGRAGGRKTHELRQFPCAAVGSRARQRRAPAVQPLHTAQPTMTEGF